MQTRVSKSDSTSKPGGLSKHARRITQAAIDRANQHDIRLLASQYVELHKSSVHELAGPCPKCGGTDRFFVGQHFFGCRRCPQPKTQGAINFVMWVSNCTFPEAVAALNRHLLPSAPAHTMAPVASTATVVSWHDPHWQRAATRLYQQAHHRLLTSPGAEPARAYLLGRGIHSHAWQAFHLGFNPAVSIPETQGQSRAPAIAIPWLVRGKVRGIRYRFLDLQQGHKQTAYYGSSFTGILYGGQALTGSIQKLRTLLIVEGELNAVSCWQVAQSTHLDVLSLGSESARLTPAMVEAAKQYCHVIAWLDRTEMVNNKLAQIPGAYGIRSPDGRDANDLLQADLLAGFLVAVQKKVAQTTT